jgi:hypothetical protein
MNLVDVLSALYESEINVRVSSFWDGGFRIELGDELNGFCASRSFHKGVGADDYREWALLWSDAADWLHHEALKRYPSSDYAVLARPA